MRKGCNGSMTQTKRILLIEDNVDDERMTLRALRRTNIMNEVVVACDGQEAMRLLFGDDANPGVPREMESLSLIILDLQLPKVSGLEVLQRIRSTPHTLAIPVVALTSSEDPELLKQAYECGVNSFLKKPNSADEFDDVVVQCMMYWLLLNQLPSNHGHGIAS